MAFSSEPGAYRRGKGMGDRGLSLGLLMRLATYGNGLLSCSAGIM